MPRVTRDPDLARRPAHAAVRMVALEYLRDARKAWKRWDRSDAPKDLHALRVALRRLRSWLRAHPELLEGSVGREDLRRLRRLARATGRCRDLDVQVEELQRVEGLSEAGGGEARRLAERLRRQRRRSAARARRVLAEELPREARRLQRHLRTMRIPLDPDEPWTQPTLARATAPVLRSLGAGLAERLAAVKGPGGQAEVHRARIAGKRLRYLLEPLAAGSPEAASVVDRLREFQDLLGEMHDAQVLGGEEVGGELEAHFQEVLARDYRLLREGWLEGSAASFLESLESLARALEREEEGASNR